MTGKKIKLDKEAISEILVADTDSESGSEASDFEDYLRGKKKKRINNNNNNNNNNNSKPQQKAKHRLQQVVDYQPGDCLKEGTHIFILLPEAPHINKDSCCCCCFSQKFFICWLNRPTCTTSNT